MHPPSANSSNAPPGKQPQANGRNTKRRFDQDAAASPGALNVIPLQLIKPDPEALQPTDYGQSNKHPSQGRRKRQRVQADSGGLGDKVDDSASTRALAEVLRRFIVEHAFIEQVLASGSPSAVELLQQPWQPEDHNESSGNWPPPPLFPIRIVSQVDALTINGFACTSLFGTMKKAARTTAMMLLDSCLASVVDEDRHPTGSQRVEQSTSNPTLLHVSASISFSGSRLNAVKNSPELSGWARALVVKDKPHRLDKLIRKAVLSPPATNPTNQVSPWSPLDRVFALKLALHNMQSANLLTIDRDSSTYTLTPVADATTDMLAASDSAAIPWIPAAHLPLPIDILTNPLLADFVLSKLTFHFRSTPRGQSNPTNPTLSIHETLRVLDKILARLFPYVPTRSIAARAILQHLAAQRRIHLSTPQVTLQPPLPGADVPPPLTPKSTITTLSLHMLAIPNCTHTGTPLMQSFTRAVWQTLDARHARTVPAMMHQLVYFDPAGASAAAAGMTESERWVAAEYAVWRAWSELKVVGIKVVEEKVAVEAGGVEVGLEEVQAQIAQSVFGVGRFDPRRLMLVELVNGAAPEKGPVRRKGK